MKVRRGGRYSEQAVYGEAFLEHFGSKNKKKLHKEHEFMEFCSSGPLHGNGRKQEYTQQLASKELVLY